MRKVGIYLKTPVFAHGQLYVALSRCTKKENIEICIPTKEAFNKERDMVNCVIEDLLVLAEIKKRSEIQQQPKLHVNDKTLDVMYVNKELVDQLVDAKGLDFELDDEDEKYNNRYHGGLGTITEVDFTL